MILKSFDFQYEFDFDFQITTSKMILILNHLYLGDLILILKSSTYDDFAHLCILVMHFSLIVVSVGFGGLFMYCQKVSILSRRTLGTYMGSFSKCFNILLP